MKLTATLAKRVTERMKRDGFKCTPQDVENVYRKGTLYTNEALASAILQEFEELGISNSEEDQ